MILAETIIYTCKNVNHQLIRNQLTIINVSLSSLSKLRTILNLITENITCRDMTKAILFNHLVALSTFTSTWRTKNYNILHYSFTKV